MIRTRVGAAGCRQVRTRGMVAAAFDHWDSRAGDPNLHTHVVSRTRSRAPTARGGRWTAARCTPRSVTVSELYDALLADEVSRRLGATWSLRDRGERRNPAFELDGVGEDLLAEFSTRSEQIHCAEQRWARGVRRAARPGAVAHRDDQGAPAPDPRDPAAEGRPPAARPARGLGQPRPRADRARAGRPGRPRPGRPLRPAAAGCTTSGRRSGRRSSPRSSRTSRPAARCGRPGTSAPPRCGPRSRCAWPPPRTGSR